MALGRVCQDVEIGMQLLRLSESSEETLFLQAKMIIHAAYGSQRHLGMYKELGLQPDQIYIHGKKARKHSGSQDCQVRWGLPQSGRAGVN